MFLFLIEFEAMVQQTKKFFSLVLTISCEATK